jgi:hypothetical protein
MVVIKDYLMNKCFIVIMVQPVRIIVSLVKTLARILLTVTQRIVMYCADYMHMLMLILQPKQVLGPVLQQYHMTAGIQQMVQRTYREHAAVNKPVNKWLAVNILMINNNINGQRYNSCR